MSSRRESFKNRGIPGAFANNNDFPIPYCEKCGESMVRLEAQWGCKNCNQIQVLKPTGALTLVNGRFVPELKLEIVPLGEAYPNRKARGSIR